MCEINVPKLFNNMPYSHLVKIGEDYVKIWFNLVI